MKTAASCFFLVLFITIFFNNLHAQKLQGTILTQNGAPIAGVSVVYNSRVISKTNSLGIFFLPEKYSIPINLSLEHPDYYLDRVKMEKNFAVFHLSLFPRTENLDEIKLSSYKNDTIASSEPNLILPFEKITSEKFDAYSPIDLITAINEPPGVFIQSGALNTNRITIRGIGSRTPYGTDKIRAYFDGIPITNGGGETAIDMFDPEEMESVEIIKGPKATQFGTNLGGTLLLNSKHAKPGETILRNSLTLGSYGLFKNFLSAGTSSKKFSININYDYLTTNGFRENDNYDRKSFLLTSKYQINHGNELALLFHYVDYFAQIPSSLGKTVFEENPTHAATTWKEAKGFERNKKTLAGLSFQHQFSLGFKNNTSIFYTYLDHYEPRPFDILDEFTNGYGARTVFDKNFLFLKNSANFSIGGEFYKDEYRWKTIENLYKDNFGNGSLEGSLLSENMEERENLNVFGLVTLSFTNKFSGQFGLNLNNTRYKFKDRFNIVSNNKSAERNFDPIIAPNINLLYRFSTDFSGYFNFSGGFNYPSLAETLTPEGVINPELSPEKGFNYELGSELFLINKKFHFKVAAYILDVDDLLVAERVGNDQYVGRNAGKTEHKGIEISISYKQYIFDNIIITPYLNAEFTGHRFIDFPDGDNNYSGNKLTGVPDKKLNGGIDFSLKNFYLNTNFIYIGKIPLNDSNELYLNEYLVCNAKMGYRNDISKNFTLFLNFGINNFTDEKYASSVLINAIGFGQAEPRFYYPGSPRNFFGGVKLAYRL